MEVSGQLYAPALLPLGKEALVSVDWGGCVGPRAGLDTLFKRRLSIPYLSHSTDKAVWNI